MSFSRFSKFEFNIIFRNFWKVRNRTISKISVNSKCLENPVSELFQTFSKLFPKFLTQKQVFLTQNRFFESKTGFFDPKTGNYFWTFSNLFSRNFREFEKTGYFWKISELRKTNFSETRENEKFRNFCLTQGLKKLSQVVSIFLHFWELLVKDWWNQRPLYPLLRVICISHSAVNSLSIQQQILLKKRNSCTFRFQKNCEFKSRSNRNLSSIFAFYFSKNHI